MRKITHDGFSHNACRLGRGLFSLGLMAAFLLAAGACSQSNEGESADTSQKTAGESTCAMTLDTSGWEAFLELTDRIEGGTDVSKPELDTYGKLPSVTVWRNSLGDDTPSSSMVGNWLEGTFWDDLGRQGKQKSSANRDFFIRTYRYSLGNRELINTKLAQLTGPEKCVIREMADYWIEPGKLPAEVKVYFLPAKPEIRILDGALVIDTGIVAAGSVGQITRQATSLLYRKFQFIEGGNPIELEGEEAVAHSFRIILNEGVTGWIEKADIMEFDEGHPELFNVKVIPEEFFKKTQQTIGVMNRQLGSMLTDEAEMLKKGQNFARHLAGMNSFTRTGFGMASVISTRLGDDRLRDASRSIPAFLAAYQEAALLNPVPAPVPGEIGIELYTTVPPLDPEIFTKLHAMLTRVFPE